MSLTNNSLFTYFLGLSYIILLVFQFTFDSLEVIWVIMELLTFIFMGILYVTTNSASSIFNAGVYFITQSMLSIVLLVCILLSNFTHSIYLDFYLLLLILVLFTNIGVFPFSSWYQSSVYSFPIISFFLALTFHKIPLLYMLTLFVGSLSSAPNFHYLIIILIINLAVFGVSANLSLDLRGVILNTSIANNIWLVLSSFVGVHVLVLFLAVYFVLISSSFSSNLYLSNWSLIAISGLPPFPMFFLNVLVLWGFLSLSFSQSYLWSLSVILFTVIVSFSYLRFVFSRLIVSL